MDEDKELDAFVGEIRAVGFDYAPVGWLPCDGRECSISAYSPLYAVIGNAFGGDGKKSFRLPDLRGKVAANKGKNRSGSTRNFAETFGSESVALSPAQSVSHNHIVKAALASSESTSVPSGNVYIGHTFANAGLTYSTNKTPNASMDGLTIAPAGRSPATPHENRQPFLVMNYIICFDGIFPPRDG